MADPFISQVVANGAMMDELFTFANVQYQSNKEPVGFKIENTSSAPTVKRIDKNFEEFIPGTNFFNNHELFQFPKCVLTPEGVPHFGSNIRGDGINPSGYIDVNGTRYYGDLMARIQNPQYRYLYEEENDTQFYLFAPYDSSHTYFDYYPSAYQGGGTRHKYFYLGCKEGSMGVDSSGNKIIRSISGEQPWTGGEIRSLAFTSGGPTEFIKGEQLTGSTSGATGYVVDYHKSSGNWEAGDAAGVVYLSLPGVTVATATAFQNNDALMISGVDRATASGAATTLPLTIDNALTYAANKGTGWTITDVYSSSLLQGLFYTQYGTLNSQSVIGKGVVDLPGNAGFAGKMTGADYIDDRVNLYGTGAGSELSGQTPIEWGNLENFTGGNTWEYIAGVNVMADGSCRIAKRDGTGILAGTLAEGSYETLPGTLPLEDGYISKMQTDILGAPTFMPAEVAGTSSTGYCDYYTYPRVSSSIVISSGDWYDGTLAGISYRLVNSAISRFDRDISARLKYIPQS